MSTKAFAADLRALDDPLRRLYWTLPAALLAAFSLLWTYAYFMGRPAARLQEPSEIQAQIVELPLPLAAAPVSKAVARPAAPSGVPATRQETSPATAKAEVSTPPVAPVSPAVAPAAENANLSGTSGAQAIYRPLPQIPEELRQDALSAAVTVRFHVAADGSATVEMTKATPNLRLNRLLLETLKNWRFFPAVREGKPIASEAELVIRVDVK